jgi:hypothetical protein
LRIMADANPKRPEQTRPDRVAASVFVGVVVFSALSLSNPATSTDRAGASQPAAQTPPEAVAFLEALKQAAPPSSKAFDIRRAGKLDAQRVLSLVSRSGVSFADVNGVTVGHVSLAKLGRDLKNRHGRFYRELIHLGYIYSLPDPRYSGLSVQHAASEVRVALSTWYAITLRENGEGLRVTDVAYLSRQHR